MADPEKQVHSTRDFATTSEENDAYNGGNLERINTFERTGELSKFGTHFNSASAELSPEHREYLMSRHDTLDLEPMPGFGDADPLNWATWKVCLELFLHYSYDASS
jgi:hypothetical protein